MAGDRGSRFTLRSLPSQATSHFRRVAPLSIEDPHLIPVEELCRSLGTSEYGLTADVVAERQALCGPNELRVRTDVPIYMRFLRQFKNFFAILLIVGGLLAVLAEQLDPGSGSIYIAVALFAVVLLNALFTFIQEEQSERIMESFKKMLPSMVRVRRQGIVSEIEAKEIVPGDIMLLYEGNKIPADSRILSSNDLKVDLSSLTGESEPVLLSKEGQKDPALIQSRNMAFSGSLVQSGTGEVVVCFIGMATQIGRIVQLTKEAETVMTPIRRELQRFIAIISAIAIFLGITFFIISIATGKGAMSSLVFAIGIIVANVPEGLLPTVTLALTMASKRMSKKNALVKNLESVETLGSTTVICTDKTGTLTQNRISVHRIATPNRTYAFGSGAEFPGIELRHLRRIMSLNNNATANKSGSFTGDSTEAALLTCVQDMDEIEDLLGFKRVAEKPFSSLTKHMITICSMPDGGFESYLKGAPEIVLAMCDKMRVSGVVVELGEEQRGWFDKTLISMASKGERCLGLAYKPVDGDDIEETGYIFKGIVGMRDPPRPEVPDALQKCRGAGIRVFMLTGDYPLTAKTIAESIGLITVEEDSTIESDADEKDIEEGRAPTSRVVEGSELEAMTEEELSSVLDIKELVFARISPAQKLQIVKALQKKKEVVTVTGDGVNDAPALKNADMGVAMGVTGTDVAKEASNMVLMDDNFATIVAAVEEGRTIFENIKKFIAYVLTSNVPEITPFIAYVLLSIPLPLTVVLILAIDLGTDIVPSLGLGAEKAETDVMRKPPRKRTERLLTRNLLGMSYGVVGMTQALSGFTSYFVVLFKGGWEWGQEIDSEDPIYQQAITAFFSSIIICQIADVLICRTRRQSIFSVGLFTNKLIYVGIATELSLLFLIAYVPILNTFFGTHPLVWWHYLLSVPYAIAIIVGDELRRLLVRRENKFVLRWLTW